MAFNFVPAGTILSYGGATAPSGWLLCDGSAISRATYAALYAAISVAWGYGDNSTTFNLPDLRGRFLRGVDGGVGRDPNRTTRTASATGGNTGDAVGTLQAQETKRNSIAASLNSGTVSGSVGGSDGTHTHGDNGHSHGTQSYTIPAAVAGGSSFNGGGYDLQTSSGTNTAYASINTTGSGHGHGHSLSVNTALNWSADGSETRPINANVNFIIKI